MKESSTNPISRSRTNAKPEVTTATKKKFTKAVFDGVAMPQRTVTTKPVGPKSVPTVLKAPIEKEARYVAPPKRVQFEKPPIEKPPIEVEDDSDTEDEDEAEIDRQILEQRKMVRDSPPHLFEPTPSPVPVSRTVTTAATRPMDHVQARIIEPIPRNQSREAELAAKIGPTYKLLSELHKEGLDEQIAKLIFENKLEISTSDLLALAPGVKKIML